MATKNGKKRKGIVIAVIIVLGIRWAVSVRSNPTIKKTAAYI